MSVDVKIKLIGGTTPEFYNCEDAEQILAASQSFPYWVVWEKEEDTGGQTVVFVPTASVGLVRLKGEIEDAAEKPDLKVVNIKDFQTTPQEGA